MGVFLAKEAAGVELVSKRGDSINRQGALRAIAESGEELSGRVTQWSGGECLEAGGDGIAEIGHCREVAERLSDKSGNTCDELAVVGFKYGIQANLGIGVRHTERSRLLLDEGGHDVC